MSWILSGFSDEISPDFTEQCQVATGLGLRYLEVRSAWDVNILDLDARQLRLLRSTLQEFGLGVSSIGSPIGKIPIAQEFGPHLDRMKHAAEVAHLLEAPFVRIFSFFLAPGTAQQHRGEVIDRMRALTRVAEDADLVLLHENEKEIYGDVPARCLDLVRSVASPHLRLAWDPANFVQVGVKPFTEGYAALRPHLAYVQIKDALLTDGSVTPAGEGDGEVVDTVRALRDDGFQGFFSLEPHLGSLTAFGAYSGPERFTRAWKAFTDILTAEGIEFS